MQACILRSPAPIETNPLELAEVPKPVPTGQLGIHHRGLAGPEVGEPEGSAQHTQPVPVHPPQSGAVRASR